MSCILKELNIGLCTRLKAHIGIPTQKGNKFLGYCSIHKSYFLDVKHTNGDIRCPICDKAWLKQYVGEKTYLKEEESK